MGSFYAQETCLIGEGTTSIPSFVTQNGQWPLGGGGRGGQFEQWSFSEDEVGFLF